MRLVLLSLLTVLLCFSATPVAAKEKDALASIRALADRQDATPQERFAALRSLARADAPGRFALAVRIASGLGTQLAASRHVAPVWEAVLAPVIEERRSLRPLDDAWHALAAPLRRSAVRLLSENGSRTALRSAMDLVARSQNDLPALLGELRRTPRVAAAQVAVVRFLRPFVRHDEPAVRAAAARWLGMSADADAAKALLRAVDDDDTSVRSAAHAALRTLTGARVQRKADAWREWLEAEDEWQRDSEIESRLRSGDAIEISRALKEVARHRFVGLRLRETIARLVHHRAVGIRLMAYATLRQIGHAEVASGLVDAIDDSDERVRLAVWQTLKAVSGLDLPQDVQAWKTARRHWRS